ncbi:MAG: RsmD family RNA methyltransferase, partial [Rhodobacteraceae bacterium]|nr:RsmD family RNA methyltransferase [Paracoccaceae bacterium]
VGAGAGALIRTNIERLRALGLAEVWRRAATAMGANRGAPYTLVFLDPPYGRGLGAAALASALAGGWVAPGALVVWEEAAPQAPPAGFALHDARRYGRSWITVLEAALA